MIFKEVQLTKRSDDKYDLIGILPITLSGKEVTEGIVKGVCEIDLGESINLCLLPEEFINGKKVLYTIELPD